MSDVMIQNKGPAPVSFSSDKLAVRNGSPAFQKSGNANQKVEIRGLAQEHVMGKKFSTGISAKPNLIIGAQHSGNPGSPPTRGPTMKRPSATSADPKRSGAPAVRHIDSVPNTRTGAPNRAPGSVRPAPRAAAPMPGLSSDQAFALGQVAETYLAFEIDNGRGETPFSIVLKEALAALHAFLPPGVQIPVPSFEPRAPAEPPASEPASSSSSAVTGASERASSSSSSASDG